MPSNRKERVVQTPHLYEDGTIWGKPDVFMHSDGCPCHHSGLFGPTSTEHVFLRNEKSQVRKGEETLW